MVGISPAHISAIEIGKVTKPGIELIQRIAEALERRLDAPERAATIEPAGDDAADYLCLVMPLRLLD